MRSWHLAFMTCGVLRAPIEDPGNETFLQRSLGAWAEAEAHNGFLGYLPEPDPDGRPTRFSDPEFANRCAITLTRWRDLESVYGFVFHTSAHASALRDRSQWFLHGDWPTSVAWWIEDDMLPTQPESLARYDMLAAGGPGPMAFDLRHPFDVHGAPATIDRASARRWGTTRDGSASDGG